MHAMPLYEDLTPFIGDQISQIRLDPYGVQFSFDSGSHLSVGHRLEHCEPAGDQYSYGCVASEGAAISLHCLIQRRVASLEREELAFTLCFQNGAWLKIHSKLGPYECGTIAGGKFAGYFVF